MARSFNQGRKFLLTSNHRLILYRAKQAELCPPQQAAGLQPFMQFYQCVLNGDDFDIALLIASVSAIEVEGFGHGIVLEK